MDCSEGTLGHHGKKIVPVTNAAIASIIARVLTQRPAQDAAYYSQDEIFRIDEVKKSRLPLYGNGDSLPDGVYLHFDSFLHLKPEYTLLAVDTIAGWERADVLVSTPATPSELVDPHQIYAFVKNGRPWIFDGSHYALLRRDGLDYYIVDKISVASQGADMSANLSSWAVFLASSLHLPLMQVSGLMVKKKFIMQLDYRNGSFVPVRPAK